MTDKEKFCRSFKWEIDIGWFDLTGYHPIDDNRRARIDLCIYRSGNQYEGVSITILDKNKGAIDKKTFWFRDYFGKPKERRVTNGYHAHQSSGDPGFDWYIEGPKDTRPICEAIEKYIGVFR